MLKIINKIFNKGLNKNAKKNTSSRIVLDLSKYFKNDYQFVTILGEQKKIKNYGSFCYSILNEGGG